MFRDIFIIVILVLILLVIRLINNKFIENFDTLDKTTQKKAVKLQDNSVLNKDTIAKLQAEAEDTTKLNEAKKGLFDSSRMITTDDVLKKKNEEVDKLFNDSHGKYVKHRNRKCDYLDINPPIPCEDISGDSHNNITDCQINCAKNCYNDDKCISFEYNRKTKSCSLSSACYDGNIETNYSRDVYFKRGSVIPAIAQFNKRPNRKCNNSTKINRNSKYYNQTITDCAKKCLDNPKCISFEHKAQEGINRNVCTLTDDCHRYNYKKSNNSDVYMKNNVIVNKTIKNNNLRCPRDNKRKLPYKKRLIFYSHPHFRTGRKTRQYTKDFWSNKNDIRSWVGRHDNDDYDSVRIPPNTLLHLYKHSRFRKHMGYWKAGGKGGSFDLGKKRRNKASSYKIINI